MKVDKLVEILKFKKFVVHGNCKEKIKGISSNSKDVRKNYLFIAEVFNEDYIAEAVKRGAIAIITKKYSQRAENIMQVVLDDPKSVVSVLCNAFYKEPSRSMLVIGITGTKGKTTTTSMIHDLLSTLGEKAGFLGTTHIYDGKNIKQSQFTTLPQCKMQQTLRKIADNDCSAAIVEVSSHAISQNRIAGIDFDIKIFTNVSSDHLDYHGNMQNYISTKESFFTHDVNENYEKTPPNSDKYSIINIDDHCGQQLAKKCKTKLLTFGIENLEADLSMKDIVLEGVNTTRGVVTYKGKNYDFCTNVIGKHNMYNILGAMASMLIIGISPEDVCAAARNFNVVPGRMEEIQNSLGISIIVDFAHNEDSMKNTLSTAKMILPAGASLMVVFGCGGNRDKYKRPKMGEAAAIFADRVIITSDNPRDEDPMEICKQIQCGISEMGKSAVILEREEAIRQAIMIAKPKDIVVIAGKGHEKYQEFAQSQKIAFDDVEVAKRICQDIESFQSV